MAMAMAWAAWYAQNGIAVLPLHWPVLKDGRTACSCGKADCASAAKHPFGRLVPAGLRDASKDLEVLGRWFHDSPFNLGIVTGAASGVIALDIDPRHDGELTLAALEAKHGELPPTWRFLTGGGGEHILFRHPGHLVANSAGKLGPGIDVRGDGGYIVAPPSRHICGRPYAISVDHHPDDVGLAECPPWLLDLNGTSTPGKKAAAKPARHWRAVVNAEASEGARNRTLASLAGHLLRNRIDPWVTLDLLTAWNQTRCRPPLAETEVMMTVASIARREINRRERRHAH
jgi:putative DNA primase/helicase